jgi:hypothetical protein
MVDSPDNPQYGMWTDIRKAVVRSALIAHRVDVTAPDKLLTPANAAGADVTTGGVLAASTAYKANVAASNAWGTTVSAVTQTINTAADGNPTHMIKLTLVQVVDADCYDIFMSTDANPLWVARITESERALGGQINVVGGPVIGNLSAGVAAAVRSTLTADPNVSAMFTVSGTGADVILTRKTKVANDGNLNMAITNGTCLGITPAGTSANTTGGVLPVLQIETATVIAAITTSGDATFTVTAAGFNGNAPLPVSVGVLEGIAQVETATVIGTITADGDAHTTVTGTNIAGTPLTLHTTVQSGVTQRETQTAVGTITTGGDAKVSVAAAGFNGNATLDLPVTVQAGIKQGETATVIGTVVDPGTAKATITAAGFNGGVPLDVTAAVLALDTATAVAASLITALGLDGTVAAFFTIGAPSGADITLTKKTAAANDATFNIAIDNGSCTGLTAAPDSAVAAAGVAPDYAEDVAGKCRVILGNDATITAFFDVTGASADMILTKKAVGADDATFNIAIDNDTCVGITQDLTSVPTRAGVAADNATAVAGKIRTSMNIAAITDNYTIGGAGAAITLTSKIKAADVANLNIAIDNGSCTGLTAAANSVNTFAGVAFDDSNAVAGKARTVLTNNATVAAFFTVTGADADVILTAKTAASNDITMNIAQIDGSCVGVTTSANSTSTLPGTAGAYQQETMTVTAAITQSGNAIVTVTAIGMGNSPKAINVPVLDTGTANEILINAVGTGLACNNALFAQNNAFNVDTITITGIDCTQYRTAHAMVKLTVDDLRSAPTLTISPFCKAIGTTDWYQGTVTTWTPLSTTDDSLCRDFSIDVDGASELKILVSSIAGQGASADINVEMVS